MTRDQKISIGSFAALGMFFAEAVRSGEALLLDDAIKTARNRFVEHPEFERRLALTEAVVRQWSKETGSKGD